MKRKVEIIVVLLLALIGVTAIILTGRRERSLSDGLQTASDTITLRNLTDDIVIYSLKDPHSSQPKNEKQLGPRQLEAHQSGRPLDLEFDRKGRRMTFQVVPGRHYTFRYDQDDLVNIYLGSHGRADAEDLAPYLPTPMVVVKKMLALAEVDAGDILFDLGCGDGRIVIEAAERYGARGVGIDIDPQRIRESKAWAKLVDVEDLVEFRLGDVTKEDLSDASVVTIYLLPESNALIRPQLEGQLKPGTIVVSHNYRIPDWETKQIRSTTVDDQNGRGHTIYVYRR